MAGVTADRHKDKPKAVRFPDGFQARVSAAAAADGVTANAFIVAAVEERLARFEAAPPADTASLPGTPPVVLPLPPVARYSGTTTERGRPR
jgi:hypothetical protein